MDEEQALLAAIRANPDDGTLRLAFADWLDEHDQPERAGWVRDPEIFRWMGPGYVSPLPAILESLRRDDPLTRGRAGPVVARVGAAIVPGLRGAFAAGNARLRRGISEVFEWVREGSPRPLSELIPALRGDNADAALLAATELGWHGPAAAPAVPALVELWERWTSGEDEVGHGFGFFSHLTTVFRRVGVGAVGAVPALLSAVDRDPSLAQPVSDVVAGMGPAAAAAVLETLGRLGDGLHWGVEIAERLGADPVPNLLGLLGNPTTPQPTRRAAAQHLARLREPSPDVTAAMRPLLRDPDPPVRYHAAVAAFNQGSAGAEAVAVLRTLAEGPDQDVADAAWQLLRRHGF